MKIEEIEEIAAQHGGKIPPFKARLVSGTGPVENVGTVQDCTFLTMVRVMTSPTDWVSRRLEPEPGQSEIYNAHYKIYQEWQYCLPGEGGAVIEKASMLFEI